MRQIQPKKESLAVNVSERTRERECEFSRCIDLFIDSYKEDSHAMNDGFIFLYFFCNRCHHIVILLLLFFLFLFLFFFFFFFFSPLAVVPD